MSRTSCPSTPKQLPRVATCIAVTLAVLTSLQCRPVADTVTGVDIGAHSRVAPPPICLHSCRERHRRALLEESIRHRRALHACRGRRSCAVAERARHRERITKLAAAMNECRRGCYGEGWGSGGR